MLRIDYNMLKPNKPKAIMLAKRQLPEFVYDAVNLEGINFTLPEIMTLLDGVTVGGHKISDQQIALNQADTWRTLFKLIEQNKFEITVETVNKRMGRFIMNGLLLSFGYPAINLPARRQLEFNQLMLSFYQTGDQTAMNSFLRSCLDERIIKIMNE